MTPEKRSAQELGTGYKYVSLGISFALGIVLFMGLGFLLDRWLKVSPAFTVVGTLVGAGVSFFWAIPSSGRTSGNTKRSTPTSTTARNEGGRLGNRPHRFDYRGSGLSWGRGAILPGLVFGALATAIEGWRWPGSGAPGTNGVRGPSRVLPREWVCGSRGSLCSAAIVMNRSVFPPLPSALGFVGVLIPLLFLEVRLVR